VVEWVGPGCGFGGMGGAGARATLRAWPERLGGARKYPVGLLDAALSYHRWAVNKRGPGGARWRAKAARGPGAAGSPAARTSAQPGAAPVGAPSRARPASLSAFISAEYSQRI
jgi:hypothetical protein